MMSERKSADALDINYRAHYALCLNILRIEFDASGGFLRPRRGGVRAVESDAQAEHPGERGHIRVQRAEEAEEEDRLGRKDRQQEGVDAAEGGVAEFPVSI